MKKICASGGAVIAVLAMPALAFAQTTNNLCDLAKSAVYYFNIAIELIIGLAVVVFVFNIYRYFFTNKENKERGMYLLWSIIGFFVILSFWGLVNLVSGTFHLNNSAPSVFGNVFGTGNTGSSPCTSSSPSSSVQQDNTIYIPPAAANAGFDDQPNTGTSAS